VLDVNYINNRRFLKLQYKNIKNYSYENNFGEVYYIFPRGINSRAAENSGVYFDKPREALLLQLEKVY